MIRRYSCQYYHWFYFLEIGLDKFQIKPLRLFQLLFRIVAEKGKKLGLLSCLANTNRPIEALQTVGLCAERSVCSASDAGLSCWSSYLQTPASAYLHKYSGMGHNG